MTNVEQSPTEFVMEIAESHPTFPDGYINRCSYCHVSWTEDSYDEYLKNADRTAQHHNDDCLWVRANALVRHWRGDA